MKIRKGDTSVKLPPVGELCSVLLDTGVQKALGTLHAVTLVTNEEFDRYINDPATAQTVGRIQYATLVTGAKPRLRFFPIPDKACTLRIRYYPPMQEI